MCVCVCVCVRVSCSAAALRREAVRARIGRWMGLRPFHRQALLAALGAEDAAEGASGDLEAPLLAQQTDNTSGQQAQQQQQGHSAPVDIVGGASRGHNSHGAGSSGTSNV